MPSLGETIRRMQFAYSAAAAGGLPAWAPAPPSRLARLPIFGSNPGALNGWYHLPGETTPAALVVVLHGCTQTAAGYDHGSGWSDLADRFGFAVLFPEQQRCNNPNLCFNWFQPEDIGRDCGEALSIHQMIGAMVERHSIDPARVFVTGLSAGGAMANVMLATYPETFAGGSIVAGLPYGTASSIPQALERMRGNGHPTASASGDMVRRAAPRGGRRPTITVWHGDADRTVVHANADAIVDQWREVLGIPVVPDRVGTVDGQEHRVWLGGDGRLAIEEYRIAGLGHGTPLDTLGSDGCGNAGAFMLEAGISSTWRQAETWGLIGRPRRSGATDGKAAPARGRSDVTGDFVPGVGAVIERALRSAGLMR